MGPSVTTFLSMIAMNGSKINQDSRCAVVYTRVSTGEQAESRLSLQAQAERCQAYCLAKGWPVVEVIEDAGESAKDLVRPGITKVLLMLFEGQTDMLVVLKLDRLTRSVKDLGEILEKMEHENWSLSAVEESFDTSTASGRLALNVLMAVSQWEREAIGERTVTALEQKRKLGEKTGGLRPYGWDVVEVDGRKKLVENEVEQAVIRQILAWRRRRKSLAWIVRALESRKVKPPDGAWNLMTLSRICKRNGLVEPRKARRDKGQRRLNGFAG